MNREKKTMDGNHAAAHVAYAFSEVAAIYPITPSSTMAEYTDEWSAQGRENIFGHPVKVVEMQSEAGAAGTVHGSLIAGALTSTFTASQGLLLMIPNIYRIAGEHLPGVFHVAARTIATHALSIFGDHSDIYACRQTGACMWALSSVQEVMDLSPVAHLSAIQGRLPFINFFDGFRTSHEMQKIEIWDYKDLKDMADKKAIEGFHQGALDPDHARMMGSAQNPDIFFQVREASNPIYENMPAVVEANLEKINSRLGTHYGLFDYYGAPDATHVIIAMGSVCETIAEVIDHLERMEPTGKYGLIKVHLYRPFSATHLLNALPPTVRQITVLDRTKEPGSVGEPLYLDVLGALKGSVFSQIPIYSGRYGLSSKNTTPSQIVAAFHNREKKHFTIGIHDDVTHLSLLLPPKIHSLPKGTISCKFWGLGGDGTVSANKNSIKIIGDHTDLYVQGYFEYDSKKSRGLTISHLRFGTSPIRSTYLVDVADLVACHNPVYLHKYKMAQELKDGGTFLLNCYYKEKDLEDYIPDLVKRYLAEHHIHLYLIDAIRIGKEIGLNNKISTILQAAFFRLSGLLPAEEAKALMKEAAKASYSSKGQKILQMNYEAIERGFSEVYEFPIPEHWKTLSDTKTGSNWKSYDSKLLPDHPDTLNFVENIQKQVTMQEGNELPVSAFVPYANGSFPSGSTAHERRNVNTEVPVWIPENCIQCNRCSYVCPHAVIRPCVMNSEEAEQAPQGMPSLPMMGMDGYHFAITVSEVDCTGCGSCAGVCPGKKGEKALVMQPVNEHEEHQEYFDYNKSLSPKKEVLEKFKTNTLKGSQFKKPLLEFHGACAGCGETPYAVLLTQLFGERMYIANATGCSSIWANSTPSTAYTRNECGQGPAWSNSLFEDAAEFGYGMLMAEEARALREKDARPNRPDPTVWVFGGDGWAYDIGFGGLDHVLASGRNINMIVFDTEVYSNTGGQASKSTPTGSTAKFVAGGKRLPKKDLAAIAMSYSYIYVAQVAMGADYNQTLKAMLEAESYDGPSLIIAYSPCIEHGLKAGMGSSMHEEAKAVEAGYFHLFRYNPALRGEGKNPFTLDSKEPTLSYEEFLEGENRYAALKREQPKEADRLFKQAAARAREKYEHLKKLVEFYEPPHEDTVP
ncbi:MAG: pyruvate:ferredoxin (flavodoxin) oxidoreductase [Lachnospiraceae bacterium]|nr:pyruvate:ferredoxin (flavodoxin) oxidoreductase [Lachnospiraceae bacterium]